MLKIAITGNIASGKSQVEKILAEKYHFPVYDADKIAHIKLNEINDFYGYNVFTDGKIDRKKLGELVFKNPELKRKLENIIHPKVKKEIIEIFKKHSQEKCVFVSIPLLYETGFDKLFDKVILVLVDSNVQLTRLIKRNNLSIEEANLRIASQLPQSQKIKRADFIIENNGSLENLYNEISEAVIPFI